MTKAWTKTLLFLYYLQVVILVTLFVYRKCRNDRMKNKFILNKPAESELDQSVLAESVHLESTNHSIDDQDFIQHDMLSSK